MVDAGSDSKIDDNFEGRTKDDSCFAQVRLWKNNIKMEDAQKSSYRFRVLFVFSLAQWACTRISYCNPLDYVIIKPLLCFIEKYDWDM